LYRPAFLPEKDSKRAARANDHPSCPTSGKRNLRVELIKLAPRDENEMPTPTGPVAVQPLDVIVDRP
jgi:hypothetical protein